MHAPDLTTAIPAATAARPSFLSRLAACYVDGWTWYARAGSLPAPEPGYPPRRLDVFAACTPAVRRAAPRFALLFGAAR